MLAKIHIPTVQYGYIEVDINGTPEEIKMTHDLLIAQFKELTLEDF